VSERGFGLARLAVDRPVTTNRGNPEQIAESVAMIEHQGVIPIVRLLNPPGIAGVSAGSGAEPARGQSILRRCLRKQEPGLSAAARSTGKAVIAAPECRVQVKRVAISSVQ
jgi:hypothetical protein